MFDKFKEEKGGEMVEERINENTVESETVESSQNSESPIGNWGINGGNVQN